MTKDERLSAMRKKNFQLKQAGFLEAGEWFSPYPVFEHEIETYYKVKSVDYDYDTHSVTVNVGCRSLWKPFGKKFCIPAHEYIDFSYNGKLPPFWASSFGPSDL